MAGRVCIVTGPTSGIGKEIARGLERLGAEVVLACRNLEKGERLREEIAREGENAQLSVLPVDLSSLPSIRTFAERFRQDYPKLHVLVNNAGVVLRNRHLTPDGLETQFVVNALAPFLLTNLLLDPLRAGSPSRVVNVASNAHYGGRIDFENLQGEREYRSLRAYRDTKAALILLTYELARRLQGTGITVNAVHPGVIRTNLGKGEYPPGAELVRPFFKDPIKGADTPLYVATAPELAGVTGRYFSKRRPVRSDDATYDEATGKRLWDVCVRLAGLTPSV